MAVSHLASSESHTGTTGHISSGSFTWDHTPGGTPRGVTVFVRTGGNAGVTLALGVTYAGVTVPEVPGGEASRTVGGMGNVKVFHLGRAVPTASPATIVVTRTSSTNIMYATCVTTLANGDTEIYEAGIEKDQSAAAITARAIDDGDSRSDSLRYACGHFEYLTPPAVGANTTALQSIDLGTYCVLTVRETTAGQGDRLLGWEEVTTADKAVLYVTVRELPGVLHLASSQSHSNNVGSTGGSSFTWNHTPGTNPRGVLIFVWTAQTSSLTESVSYGGVAVPAVAGGAAHRAGGETGSIETFFLGANLPTSDPAPVLVTRAAVAVRMWAVCITVNAGYDLEVYAPGIVAVTPSLALAEVSVDDGSPGTPSQRYAGGHFAYDTPPVAGANSTVLYAFDPGTRSGSVVRETVPGQGLRPIGWDDALAEEKAVVYLALREIVPSVPVGDTLNVIVYGYSWPISPIEPGPASLTLVLAVDVLHIADAAPIVVNPSQVTFTASPDHATVTNYTAQLWPYPTPGATPVDTLSLGVPTPDANDTITADLALLYAGQAPGDYTVSILTTTVAGGSTDSEMSNAFTLPLV